MAKSAIMGMRAAVVVSILAHASLIGAAGLRKPPSAPAELAPPTDVWAGTTALPTGSEELVDVEALGGSSPETQPAPPALPAAPPGNDSTDEIPIEPSPPVVPDKPAEPDKPKAKAPEKTPEPVRPKVDPPKAEKPEPKDEPAEDKKPEPAPEKKDPKTKAADPKEPAPNSSDKPEDQDKPPSEAEKKPARTAKRPKPGPAPAATPANADGSADGTGKSPSGGSFGAEGTATVRDLGKAFTRALPAASSPEKTWGSLKAGSAGSIEVAVAIGEEGKVTGFEVLSKDPPAHLLSAVKRTVDMLKFGTFMRNGETATTGRNVFRLVAEVSEREVSEEDVSGAAAFGLGSEWDGRKGKAHFTQVSGKHVEMSVEFVRALPAKE